MAARRIALGTVFAAVLAVSSFSVGGCGRHRGEPLYASTVIVGDSVLVRVKHAYVKGDRVVVKTYMENRTDQPVTIDRDAIGLRLANGNVIPRASGRTTRHEPYVLGPREGRDVHVDFRLGGRHVRVDEAHLVIDGVSIGDEEPRELGEVALSSRHAIRRNVAKMSAEEAEAAKAGAEDGEEVEEAGEEAAAEEAAAEEAAAEPAEASDGEAEAEPVEEPSESWQIGN
jgi:hypothetical protein